MNSRCTGLRVLFTGQYWPGANTVYIARAFEACGAIVRLVNDTAIFPGWTGKEGKIVRRLLRRPVIEREWNRQVLGLVETFAPDLVYLTNLSHCWPETLEAIRRKAIPLMGFYHDPTWKEPGSRFPQTLPYLDLVATTRSWQAPAFRQAGAREVMVVRFGYDPLAHRPLTLDPQALARYGAEVTFIGTKGGPRAQALSALVAADFPYQLRLWGGFWDQLPRESPLGRFWQGRDIHEQEIPVIYAASQVALHFLKKEPDSLDETLRQGDQHNSRTFQIAACGGAMMLAQRTAEHRQFFTEDVEAVYFEDVAELREKLAYWLDPARDQARRDLAAAARARCLKEDYSYVPVVRRYLEFFNLPVAAGH